MSAIVLKRRTHTFGILEDRHYPDGNVPGTALLDDQGGTLGGSGDGLKRGTGRRAHIILQPQPSDDPRDPLSWPTWKKEALYWTLSFSAGLVGAMGPLLSAGYAVLSVEWGVSVNSVAATNGDLVLALGIIMIFIPPFAVKFGRRPVFIIAILDLFLCSIWSGGSTSIESFKWSRIFHGFGMAPFEALIVSTFGDIFFVDQRGFRSAIWGFALLAGINITPIANGYLVASPLGWKWCFWLVAIFFGLATILVVLFCPETAYDRSSVFDTDAGKPLADVSAINHATEELEKDALREPKPIIDHLENGATSQNGSSATYLPAKSVLQELAPYSGYRSKENFFKLVARPLPFFLSPAVWFAIFSYGLTTAWLVVLSVTSSVVFGSPPYNFDSIQTGLTSIGPLVASIPSTLIAGPLCDWSATYFARKNGGVFEPEFRLVLMIPMLLLEVFGFMGWSLMVENGHVPWIGPVIMYSMINVGQGIGSTAIVTYIIDVHRKHTPEAFAVVNLTKNSVLYGFTQFAVSWVTTMGVPHTMGVLAGVSAICILTTVPMYIYGKRIRSFVARHEALYLSVEKI